MKVIVTGGSGLLGRAVVSHCKELRWDVTSLGFSRISDGMVKVDLRNREEVKQLLEKVKPDFIIHSAAERFPDKVEKEYENTRKLNVSASEDLSSLSKENGSKVLYISTDYVFDGSSPPYKAEDEAKPLNKYGITKLDGEKAVLGADPNSLVLRVPVLYGPVEYLKESAVTCLLDLVRDSSKEVSVSHYEKRYPAHVDSIASVICQLLTKAKQDSEVRGIYQFSGAEQLTKYQMCLAIAKKFNLPHSHIIPDDKATPGASRPYDSRMDTSKLEQLGISHTLLFDSGIESALGKWINMK